MTPTDNTPVGASSVQAPGVPSFPPVETTASGDAPTGVKQTVTPSGIEIYYQSGPKRLYRIRTKLDEDFEQVPSMSDILNIYDKPGLPWWGMGTGVEGCIALSHEMPDQFWGLLMAGAKDEIVDLLTKHRLTVNHVRDKAGVRGTDVHTALETWAEYDILPDPSLYDPDLQGYVQGVKQFLLEAKPDSRTSEVMVASMKMGYAGRFDNIIELPNDVELYVHRTEAGRGDRKELIEAGRYMIDCKTSKGVYETHHLQLAGYRLALEESYGETVDGVYVLHVLQDGRYALVEGKASAEDFIAARKMYDVYKRLK